MSDLNPEASGKNRFTYPPQADDLEIVAFHRMGEVKSLQFLYRERESLNLGDNINDKSATFLSFYEAFYFQGISPDIIHRIVSF